MERLFGWTRAEANGQLLHDLLKSQFPHSLDEIRAELVQNGQWQGEVLHRHKQGHELHAQTHWILYRDRFGNPIGVAEIHNDVSALRRAEGAIRAADRRKDEFLAMLAHELRNPLAPIRSGLELMKLAGHDQKLVDQTRGIMERQMQQLVRLVDDLLDVSRITRGKLELRNSQVTLADVVRSAVEAAKPTIEKAGHQLTVNLPEAAIQLHADPHRLAQVFSNLLDNAAKYTPRGGKISLSAERHADDIVVLIKDSGIGVPANMLDGIFEMFTRVERTAETATAGLGIGLALVKSIVEMHGGSVEAQSNGSGQGTEVRVRLPLALAETATAQEPTDLRDRGLGYSRRVLVVDDNEAAANLLSIVMEKLGNQVRVAYDGQQAIEIAERFQPDIVFMDLAMPKLDGYGAARHIRQKQWGQKTVLVALSGWGQDGHKRRAQEAGFDHHLVKPADTAQLERLLSGIRQQANARSVAGG
jgi:PAS domain S-box-containing protein